jgi:hypothetical protein
VPAAGTTPIHRSSLPGGGGGDFHHVGDPDG